MALATQEDVVARLGRPLSEAEAAKLPALLSDASSLLLGWVGRSFGPYPPDAVVGVVAKMVARNLLAAANTTTPFASQQAAGPFSISFNSDAASGDLWLTAADKIALRPHRRGGLTSVQFVGERYSVRDDD